jgi:hypothetical protein
MDSIDNVASPRPSRNKPVSHAQTPKLIAYAPDRDPSQVPAENAYNNYAADRPAGIIDPDGKTRFFDQFAGPDARNARNARYEPRGPMQTLSHHSYVGQRLLVY